MIEMPEEIFSKNPRDRKLFTRFMTVVIVIIVYVLISSFLFNFFHDKLVSSTCRCTVPLNWILILLSVSGVVVGVAVYYYLSSSFQQDRKQMKEGVEETLNFLPEAEKKIVEVLVEKGGEEYQSKIVDATGFNRTKVSRKISKLVDKDIVKKDESGMSNLIELREPFQELYISDQE